MVRVFWFNGGVWHEDLPPARAAVFAQRLAGSGYMVWQRLIATR